VIVIVTFNIDFFLNYGKTKLWTNAEHPLSKKVGIIKINQP